MSCQQYRNSNELLQELSDCYNKGWIDLTPGNRVVFGVLGGLLALLTAAIYAFQVVSKPLDSTKKETIAIAAKIAEGADAFLRAEYKVMSIFVGITAIVLIALIGWETMVCFLVGAFLSGLCGWLGMKIATRANVRTTLACQGANGLNEGLRVAFKSGSVMAMLVVGFGLLGLSILYLVFENHDKNDVWVHLSGFAFGGSSIALFARVGGGIYTKAADVGADLVGKVEEELDEDSPDNPATIADNVGDNVGDVAGMGADLFESFVGSIVAASTLGQDKYGAAGVALPFYVAGLGAVCSIVGTMMVRVSSTADSATAAQRLSDETGQEHEVKSAGIMEKLLDSIRFAIYFSSFLIMIATILAVCMTFGPGENLSWNLFACVVIGLVCGNLIGYTTEYATSFTYPPTVSIAKKADTGAATVIIQGLGVGMLSSVPPVLFMFLTILSTYYIAGSDYGVAIAAVGMLSTLGVTLATDAFGPVADNAGGIAEMAPENEIPHDVRDRTDALDALGNTTAATGKGFAIGSAVLTALALLSAITDNATPRLETVNILAPVSLPAVLIGALMPYLFSALTMLSVGQAAESIMWECRNQLNLRFFQNKPLDATGVISISTRSSLKEMVAPGVIAIVVPIIVGLMLGTPGLISLLSGSTSSGFLLAVLMSNAGGAWDNAKKFIEKGGLGPGKGKKSPQHKAAVVGDTVGDPFKDTSGPSLNILIKLMSIVALVMAKQLDQDAWAKWWQGLIFIIVLVLFIIGYLSFGAKLMGSQLDHDAIDRQSAERKQRQAAAKGSEKKEDH